MACMTCLAGRLSGLTLGTGKVEGRHAMMISCGKLKTRKAAAKRFKVTGSGKILMRRPGKQHINEKKSPKRLRELGKELEVDKGNKEHIVRNLPYANIK